MSGTRPPTKRTRQQEARAKAAAFREAERRRAQRRRILLIVSVAVVLLLVGGGVVALVLTLPSASASAAGPEGIPIETGTALAADTTSSTGATADGVQCGSSEQTAYHIHSHLAVYVNGKLRPLPPGIGIVGAGIVDGSGQTAFWGLTAQSGCYYWLHVHAQDGVIHIESPAKKQYTLGQFFAVWGQPLSSTQVATAKGTVTAFVNGERVSGDPSSIQLGSQKNIQLDVGKVVPFKSVNWKGSGL